MGNRDEFEGTDMSAALTADAVVASEASEPNETRARASRRDFAALFGLLGGAVGASMLTGCATPGADGTGFGGGGDAGLGGGGDAGNEYGSNAAALTGTANYQWFTCIGVPAATPLATSLRTLNPGTAASTRGRMVFVSGFWVEGDGGGGMFWWDNTPGLDNLGLRVNPTTTPTNLTTPAPGWVRVVPNGQLNVRWFGAKGDGVTDDTQSLQKAFDVGRDASLLASSVQGILVYVPRGRYKVMQNVGADGSPRGLCVQGEGRDASVIVAGYTNDGVGKAPAAHPEFYGLVSIVGTSAVPATGCTVRDLGVRGPVDIVAYPTATGNTSGGAQKGISFHNCKDAAVVGCSVVGVRDEAIYADLIRGWSVTGCLVRRCICNAINMNGAWTPTWTGGGGDVVVSGNVIDEVFGSGIQVGGNSVTVTGNTMRQWPGQPIGYWPVVLDIGQRGIFSGNIISDYDTSYSSCGGVSIFGGTSVPESVLHVTNNLFSNILGGWDTALTSYAPGAGVEFRASGPEGTTGYAGVAIVSGNTFHNCGLPMTTHGPSFPGRFVLANQVTSTARVFVQGNFFKNPVGYNLVHGVVAGPTVAAGVVHVGDNFYENVELNVVNASTAAALRFDGSRRIVSTVGTTALAITDELVIVNVNGSVSLQLPLASSFASGRRQLIVRNSAAQINGTLLLPASGESVDGSTLLSGPFASRILEAVNLGASYAWFVVGQI